MVPAAYSGEYALGLGGPGEGPGVLIVLGEIAVDGRLQVDDRTEDAALEPPSPGQGREGRLTGREFGRWASW